MKTLVRKLLGLMGYTIAPLMVHPRVSANGKLRFGQYEIESHSKEQIDNYAAQPNVNQVLGRLAACLGHMDSTLGIIDVGAHCGDTAALIRCSTSLPILCVEGDSKMFALLQKNAARCPDITAVNCYVGETSGPMAATVEKEGWNSTLIPMDTSTSVIQIIRLDELRHPWLQDRRIGLLKVDTEGFDVSVLFGAKALLETSRPILAFEYNRYNMDAIHEPGLRVFPYLQSLGYEDLLIYDHNDRYLFSAHSGDGDLLAELHAFVSPPTSSIAYWDIVAFPRSLAAHFKGFRDAERKRQGS